MKKTLSQFVNGRYVNPFNSNHKGFLDVVKYLVGRENVVPLTVEEKQTVHKVMPVDFERVNSEVPSNTIRATWIGHATVLVQMQKYNFITDPVWTKHPTPFGLPVGPVRIADPPCKISELPKLDFVLISHNHYDHLDIESIKAIGNGPMWFIPKGMQSWFHGIGITNVRELDWWEESVFDDQSGRGEMTVVFTPTNHYSQRTLTDRYKVLWGSWVVKGDSKRFFFTGDTAWCDVFKEIGYHYGEFDFAAIPIGAYDQNREFMAEHHCDVKEAVQIHKDLKSKKSLGIHWGTFILSTEPILEPPTLLKSESRNADLEENEFYTTKIGETIDIVS
eukprot:gene2452-3028_t